MLIHKNLYESVERIDTKPRANAVRGVVYPIVLKITSGVLAAATVLASVAVAGHGFVAAQTTAPSAVAASGLPACATGAYSVNLGWTGAPGTFGFFVDVGLEPNFQTNFWHKHISVAGGSSHAVAAPAGFTVYDIPTGRDLTSPALTFQPDTRYYVRAVNGDYGAPVWGPVSSFMVPKCTPASNTPPAGGANSGDISKAPVIDVPACAHGPYQVRVHWSGNRNPAFGFFVDVSQHASFSSFWNRQVPEVMTNYNIVAPDGFGPYLGVSGGLQLLPGQTYYVRAYNGQHSATSSFSVPACSNQPAGNPHKPIGHFDGVTSDGYMVGWALDFGRPHDHIEVHAYFGGLPGAAVHGVAGIMANLPRPDVNQVIGVPGNHGFRFPVPQHLRNGQTYEVYIFALDTDDMTGASNVLIAASPRVFNLNSTQPGQPPVQPPPAPTQPAAPMYFDTANHEFVLADKAAMDPHFGKGLWLSNQRIKVYRNVHGSNWAPMVYAGKNLQSAFTLDPLDPLMPTYSGGGVVYINDGARSWANNPYQMAMNERRFESRVGLGYTKQVLDNHDLNFEMSYFVPSYDSNDPVIIQLVEATHTGAAPRSYSFTSYQNISTTGSATFSESDNALVYNASTAHDSWGRARSSSQKLFLTSTLPIQSYDANAASFLGSGTEANPAGVVRGRLGNSLRAGDNIMAAQVSVDFQPNETKRFAFILGAHQSTSEMKSLLSKYSNVNAAQSALNATRQSYLNKTNRIPGLSGRGAELQTQLRLLGMSAISTSMWWDNFVDDFTLNQMSRYLYDVNARDTAQVAMGLNYLDPNLARSGLETFIKSQQFANGKIPYGMDSGLSRGAHDQPDWGSDNIGWITYAACEYVQINGDRAWLNKTVGYRDDVNSDTIYRHIINALNYDYNKLHANGLVDTMGGDWLDQVHGSQLEHGESIYASALLYNATANCLPLMTADDKKFYAGRAATLKNAIEAVGFDEVTGRYIRFISQDGRLRVGSSQDNRVFSDLAMLGWEPGFNIQRLHNTLLASYGTNGASGGRGNLVYTPPYAHADFSLGVYTMPDWVYDNKVWGRVCAVVTVGLHRAGLSAQAEDNFAKCLPNRMDPKHSSPFNYLEYMDPRGNIVVPNEEGRTISLLGFSSAVDDSMNIWAFAQLSQPAPAYALDGVLFPDGTLVKVGHHNIYVIENGRKRLIADWNVFYGMGFQVKNVVQVNSTAHADGPPLLTADQRHVRGTMALDASGVGWFLGQHNRQPFPSYEVLQSWGGTFAQLVPMNAYDLQLPVGPVVQKRP